ncbi:MAG: COP23 domain-containing protein [Cyanobacteria bacterium J06614_10]
MVDNQTPTTHLKKEGKFRRSLLLCSLLFAGLTASPLFAQAQTNDPLPDVEPGAEESQVPTEARFECQLSNGEYTVMYLPESQPGAAYPWATPGAMGGGWTAERRCFTISERLESYRPEGLAELQVGTENGYDIVCATTEQLPNMCKIVFTVPPGQNPVVTRDQVFENLALADSGTDTTIVNTFTAGDDNDLLGQIGDVINNFPLGGATSTAQRDENINLKPFLSPADGGTGAALTRPAGAGRPLNPDNFR